MRQFNVFSELVVTYPKETFAWVVEAAEIPQVDTSITVYSNDWPLTNPSYVVRPGPGTSATTEDKPGAKATFACDPSGPSVGTQTIVVASQAPISVCNDATVQAGDYFIWENTTSSPVTIKPDEGNPKFWPLPGQDHVVPANGWLAVPVPDDAEDGEYALVVTSASGGSVCPEAAQPKLILQSGL